MKPTIISLVLGIVCLTFCCSAIAVPPNKSSLSGTLSGKVDYLSEALHGAGITVESLHLPSRILRIRIGSPAQPMGFLVNDEVVHLVVADPYLDIQIKRNGKIYQQRVAFSEVPSGRGSLTVPAVVPSASKSAKEITLLRASSFYVMQDCSKSMLSDLETDSGTRWSWCSRTLADFALKMQSIAGEKPYIIFFSEGIIDLGFASSSVIQNKFSDVVPSGSTNIGDPLEQLITKVQSSSNQKIPVIVVISDGVANKGRNVTELLDEYISRNRTSRLRVIFLMINDANDFREGEILKEQFLRLPKLERFVKVIEFSKLKRDGFVNAISDALDN